MSGLKKNSGSKNIWVQKHFGSEIFWGVLVCKSSSIKGRLQTKVVFHQRSFSIEGGLPSKVIFHKRLSSIKSQFLTLRETFISNMSLLRNLEPFGVVVGRGLWWSAVGGWWWLRVILVLIFGLSQAEQKTTFLNDSSNGFFLAIEGRQHLHYTWMQDIFHKFKHKL